MPVESLKFLGPLAIGIFWEAIVFMVFKWGKDHSLSISRHAAKNRSAFIFFGIVSTIAQPLFMIYVVKWLVPRFQLGSIFKYTILSASVFQVIAAWFPDIKGKYHLIHRVASYEMALVMLIVTYWIGLSRRIPVGARIFSIVCALIMTGLVTIFVASPKFHKSYLLYQGIYIGLAHISAITVAYVR